MVERGDRLVWCAGALAALYEQEGGPVVYAGKPYAPIYFLALETINGLAGSAVPRNQILVIGDGVHTDIAGAANLGIDSVFVASGLHAPGGAGGEALGGAQLEALFAQEKTRPIGAMRALLW